MSERKYRVICTKCGTLNHYTPQAGAKGARNIVDPDLSPKSKRREYRKRYNEKKKSQSDSSPEKPPLDDMVTEEPAPDPEKKVRQRAKISEYYQNKYKECLL